MTMSDGQTTKGSVGPVQTRTIEIALPQGGFQLDCGQSLPELQIAYETYGNLSPKKDNAVFLCHALSGSAHVAGYHEPLDDTAPWWDNMVGPGKGIDTRFYYVICANIIGGCKGTTGPSSVNPATGRPYGSSFPQISIGDMVSAHRLLLKQLGIERLAAVIGGSMGGMQVLEWIIRYPDMIDNCICIASAAALSAQSLAFDIIGRKAVTSDPHWNGGDFYGTGNLPGSGLALARQIGHVTYLSQEMMETKFGREKTEVGSRFQVESYLDYQGGKFIKRFDANSYLHITSAIDQYHLSEKSGSLEKAFEPVRAKVLVVALSSDWLFPPNQSIDMANALLRAGKHVTYCELDAPHGHDSFLVDVGPLGEVIRAFLPWVKSLPAHEEESVKRKAANIESAADETCPCCDRRKDYSIITEMIRPGSRVLDLGCGNGELLRLLAAKRNISGIGVDIDVKHVIAVIEGGQDIFQGDIDHGLQAIPDDTFDCAILSETLQVVKKPQLVLREMLRVAKEGIVSFPNFGNWSHRLRLLCSGRMPKGGALPFEWYDTPNIHLFTLDDFIQLCREDHIRMLDTVCIPESNTSKALLGLGFRNLGADRILVRIVRETDKTRAEGK